MLTHIYMSHIHIYVNITVNKYQADAIYVVSLRSLDTNKFGLVSAVGGGECSQAQLANHKPGI